MKVNKFVFASTSAVYGEPEYLPVNDCHKTNPISPYGLSKLNFEQYLKYFSSYSDINITIFRLPNVYGPRQRSDLEGGVVAIFYELMKKICQLIYTVMESRHEIGFMLVISLMAFIEH